MNSKKHTYPFGIIGNCSYMSYISTQGDVVWQCWPKFDSSFIFGSLLSKKNGGCFQISPEKKYTSSQHYIENTNILVTHFKAEDGEFRVIDFAPRFLNYERHHKPISLFRKVELISGSPLVKIKCRPVGNYGSSKAKTSIGSNSINYLGLDKKVRLTTDASLTHIENETPFSLTENKHLVLTWGNPLEAPLQQTFEDFFQRTKDYWQRWIKATNIPNIYQSHVIRSALLLKLHQYEDTGAIIASGTTSLPEHPGSGRNWDYRYCWIRDSYFTLNALIGLGHFNEAEKYAHWIQDVVVKNKNNLQPVYKICGDPEIKESSLDLEGYMNNGPVRIGNEAYVQKQYDVFGQMILSLEPLYTDKRVNKITPPPPIELIEQLLDEINKVMDEPDAGIWEFRGIKQRHAESYLFHWAGANAAIKIAKSFNNNSLQKKANDIVERSSIEIEKCYDDKKEVYGMSQENKDVNASEFLLITMQYLTDIEKSKKHISALEAELKTNGDLIYRYLALDDFGTTESTFLICGFWYAESLIEIGQLKRAREVFESLLEKSNHLGIYSEDICPKDFSQWGNFAQTYSHVGLITTAQKLARKLNKPGFLVHED
tara:strand:+ start:1782 stop:3575 length:1794 start_codon:yes stop_codon:yes gene_type:complete